MSDLDERNKMAGVCVPQRKVDAQAYAEVLRKAFDQVCNPDDWKAPIHALVPVHLVSLYCEAVEFMVGTKPTLQLTDTYGSDGHLMLRLTSIGYRAGPAS